MDSYTVRAPIFYFRCFDAIYAHLLQFTHFFCGARNVAIYAFWEPKKTESCAVSQKNRISSPAPNIRCFVAKTHLLRFTRFFQTTNVRFLPVAQSGHFMLFLPFSYMMASPSSIPKMIWEIYIKFWD